MTDISVVQTLSDRAVLNVERAIVGKRREVQLVLLALLCRGHVLIEDVPGVGKTVVAKAFAKTIGCSFKRIQFTPDLLPSDVTGVNIFNSKPSSLSFARDRLSLSLCWPMKLTGRRQKPSHRCSKPWKRHRLRWMATPQVARAIHRAGDRKSD